MSGDIIEKIEKDRNGDLVDEQNPVPSREELWEKIQTLEERIQELEDENSDDAEHVACEAELCCRRDMYGALSANEERAARIWKKLPEYAGRNGMGDVTYSLDYDRLRDALAAVDPGQWESGEKVKSQQVKYAREAFEDVAHAFVKDGEGGAKKVVVYAEQWAVDRPEEVCRRLMSPRDVEEFIAGGGE